MTRKGYLIALILILIGAILFFYFNPLGIKIGYSIHGGKEPVKVSETLNAEAIYHEYLNQIDTYDRYRNDDNPTAQKWAENAKNKANELADQYNELMGEFVLNGLGE